MQSYYVVEDHEALTKQPITSSQYLESVVPIEAFIKYSSTQYKTRLQSFLDTLSSSSPWNPIPIKGYHVIDHDETPPVTEIFSELHFKESSSTENSSLQLCTEGLGSESYYDLEDGKVNCNVNGKDDIEVKGKEENGKQR
ncbi:hypothetical protein Bca101_032986 [Brassica carinata]